jgi:Holliday junction DNA helicase RuvA
MIARLEGELVAVAGGRALVRCGPLTYEVLIPACDEPALAAQIGTTARFQTFHYLESHGQGSSFTPRLIGFTDARDRAFFELFTTVKGMGNRKALRAIALPVPVIAEAIATKDLVLLKSLPEVGRRTAETIVAELHGKVDRFIEFKPVAPARAGGPAGAADAIGSPPGAGGRRVEVEDAVAMLVQLGESSPEARLLIERIVRVDPGLATAGELVSAALRQRGS